MGLDDICRILLLSSCIFSVIYAIYHLRKHKMPLFFKCAFYASVSRLLCTFIYFVLAIDPTWNHYFSLGDFGSVASALFIVVAIRKYIPKEYEELKEEPSIPGIIVALFVWIAYMSAILFVPKAETIFGSIVCGIPLSLCSYSCAKTIQNRHHNPFAAGVKKFCILFLFMLVTTALGSAAFSSGNSTFYNLYLLSSSFISPVIIALEMYFLKKGLEPWSI